MRRVQHRSEYLSKSAHAYTLIIEAFCPVCAAALREKLESRIKRRH